MSVPITITIAIRSGANGSSKFNTASTNEACVAPDVFVVFMILPFEMAFKMAFCLTLSSHLNG